MNFKFDFIGIKPRICVIGYSGFNRFISPLVGEYSSRAEFSFYQPSFEDALTTARKLEHDDLVDVFLSAGANATYLANNTKVPVISVGVSGFDILHALLKARLTSNKVGIVSYKNTFPELEEVKTLLNLDIKQLTYTTSENARECFRELASDGFKVILGTSLVVELAEQHSLHGILIYSAESVCRSIEDALKISHIINTEKTRYERLNTIIQYLPSGVVAVDLDEKIQAINPYIENLLGAPRVNLIGRKLSHLSKSLSLEETLSTGVVKSEETQKIGHRTVVVNRIPIIERGILTGALLTTIESGTIQRFERSLRTQVLGRSQTAKYTLNDIIGQSTLILQTKILAEQYARINSTILITGETGTGKELFAQGIHNKSDRNSNPFLAINCGAFPDTLLESELFGHIEGAFTGAKKGGKLGLFESAHTGTIFLDEIGEMPIMLQTRLLRVLQEKEIMRVGSTETTPIDVRVIAATNKNLNDLVRKGLFRSDLLYRLNVLCIALPSLHDRRGDISSLSSSLFDAAINRYGSNLSKDKVLELILPDFEKYHWPGNVRELENVINRLVVSLIYYTEEDICRLSFRNIIPEIYDTEFVDPSAASVSTSAVFVNSLKNMNKGLQSIHIRKILNDCNGDTAEAAKRLGISRTTLWRKLKVAFPPETEPLQT